MLEVPFNFLFYVPYEVYLTLSVMLEVLLFTGFITDGEDIICPECAKEKLMGP